MSSNGNAQFRVTDVLALSPHVVNQRSNNTQKHIPPTARDLQRLIERRRAQELGYELPLNLREAAAYVGHHKKTMKRMARDGQVPAHPASDVRRKAWNFYASELDAWLASRTGGTECLYK